MDRPTLIQQKVAETKAQLEQWAKDTLQLTDIEQFRCEVKLWIKQGPFNAKVPGRRKAMRCRKLGTALSIGDWQRIMSVPWTDYQHVIIGWLRLNGNQIKPNFLHSRIESINRAFRDAELNYRIYEVETGREWGQVDISIFVVEIPTSPA